MDENNEGTPNPLNPNPTPEPAPTSTPEPTPAPTPVLETEPLAEVKAEDEVEIETAHEAATNPMNRPMEQAPTGTVEQPKKKTGLIVGILVSLLVMTACGVAAVLLFANNNDDAVGKAISKLMGGNAPSNMTVDGTISITPNKTTSSITNMKIDLKSDLVSGSMINSTVANLTVEAKNNKSLSVELDEMYGTDGDLFLKVNGVSELLKNSALLEELFNPETTPVEVDCAALSDDEETDCIVEETNEITTNCENETNCVESGYVEEVTAGLSEDELAEYSELIKMFDNKWFRISTDELTAMTGDEEEESELSCVIDLVKSTNNSSNSLADNYSKNPFIYSNDKDVAVMRKANPIYEIGINKENFANFVDSMKTSELVTKINDCFGGSAPTIDTDETVEAVGQLPAMYVEVDSNYNFTRLYFVKDINDGAAKMTVDLGFSYPTNVNISEPTEYEDLSTLIQEMFSGSVVYESTGDDIEILPTE